jgi:hypothetical protein
MGQLHAYFGITKRNDKETMKTYEELTSEVLIELFGGREWVLKHNWWNKDPDFVHSPDFSIYGDDWFMIFSVPAMPKGWREKLKEAGYVPVKRQKTFI